LSKDKSRRGKTKARRTAQAVRSGSPPGMASPGKEQSRQVKDYRQLATQLEPRRPILRNVIAAFLVGGVICTIGQGAMQVWNGRGLPAEQGASLTAATMIVLAAILTGLGVYDLIGHAGGMGSAIPITGFANSIVAPALEFKREGYVLGVGARLFQVAGPVIVWGTFVAIVVGALRMLFLGA